MHSRMHLCIAHKLSVLRVITVAVADRFIDLSDPFAS